MAGPAVTDPFASPRVERPVDLGRVRRTLGFLVRRGARLGVAVAVIPLCAWMIFGLRDPMQVAAWVALAIALWLPPTVVQARVTFAPSPPDPWLGADGVPKADRDLRAVFRSEVAEWLVGSLPPVAVAVWFVIGMAALDGPWKIAIVLVVLVLMTARVSQTVLSLLVNEARLDLEALRPVRLLPVLERVEPLAWAVGRADHVRYLVARGRFRLGDLDGALASIDRIRGRATWRTDLLRALFGIERDGPEATLRTAEQLRAEDGMEPVAETLAAFAHLYRGEDALVLARADRLLSVGASEGRWFGAILLAAARARTDPDGARSLLATLPWDPWRVRELARCWSALDARLRALDEPGSAPLR